MPKIPKELKKRKTSKAKIIYVAIMLILAGFGGFFFVRYMQVNSKYQDAVMTQDQRNQQTLAKIGKLMDLPKDEKPIIFEVKDKDKLGNLQLTKTFFEKTKNGDVILAYEKANLSIIYRPSENRIIKTDNFTNFYGAANPIKVAIIAPNDMQATTEKAITQKVLNIDIVSKQPPKSSNTQSMVVDVSGTNAKAAKDLADKLGIPVGQLPEGETKPDGATLAVITVSATSPSVAP
jgi:hypothetical protein